jgi:hypothetical protein
MEMAGSGCRTVSGIIGFVFVIVMFVAARSAGTY